METRISPQAGAASVIGQPKAPGTLREATQEFESLFVAQMMQTMRRTAPESGLMGTGRGLEVFRGMLDEETARQVAHSGGLGIGELLFKQLTRDEASGERRGTSVNAAAGDGEAVKTDTASLATSEGTVR